MFCNDQVSCKWESYVTRCFQFMRGIKKWSHEQDGDMRCLALKVSSHGSIDVGLLLPEELIPIPVALATWYVAPLLPPTVCQHVADHSFDNILFTFLDSFFGIFFFFYSWVEGETSRVLKCLEQVSPVNDRSGPLNLKSSQPTPGRPRHPHSSSNIMNK